MSGLTCLQPSQTAMVYLRFDVAQSSDAQIFTTLRTAMRSAAGETLVTALAREYPPAHILVEAANSGRDLIQELRRAHDLHVTAVSARRSKEERAVSVAALVENGDVALPESADWLGAFMRELRSFPHGRHDDMVDAFVHGLRYLKRHIERLREPRHPAPTEPRMRAPARRRRPGYARPA